MTKDDRYGLAGAVFCAMVAWLDPGWRPFWLACGVLLSAWTFISLGKQK